ncbi:hypothetical protein Moror_15896 [Moniliophthora roreri MCA 2997]|uniref:Uncharacterized protein n=1 Tax=Moniliophthora roreri (strain MCA 2997) TaxID=1381753 RepID=V2YM72_MONRO|nr:hypothetical protein Moror_15896 [Moniliophthora roreri MCA 2997]
MTSLVSGWNQTARSFDEGVKRRDPLEGVLNLQFNIRIVSGFRIKKGIVGRGFGGWCGGGGELFLKGRYLGRDTRKLLEDLQREAWIGADITSKEDLISDFKVATLSDLGE